MSLPQYLTYLVDDAYCFFTVENKEMDSIQNKSTCKLEVTGVCCRGSSHHTERESRSLCQERKRNFFFFCHYEWHVELPRCVCVNGHLCLTLCDPVDWAHQTPLSMEFSKQKYGSGLPFPTSGDLPDPGIEPVSLRALCWQAFFSIVPPGKTMELPGPGIKSALGSNYFH